MKLAVMLGIAAIASSSQLAAAPDISAKTYSDRVARLTEIQRLAVMRRAVLDAGEACQRPTEARIRGGYKNMIMWTARCAPAGDYAVFIGPNALVQVRDCAQAAQLKLPACGLAPRPAAAPTRR
jgi:hypothetical protein